MRWSPKSKKSTRCWTGCNRLPLRNRRKAARSYPPFPLFFCHSGPFFLSFRRKPESLFLLRPRHRKGARSARIYSLDSRLRGNGRKKRRRRFLHSLESRNPAQIERGTRTLQRPAARPFLKRSAKRAHYSLDSRPCSSQGQALRGNGGMGAREWRSDLYSLDTRGVFTQTVLQEWRRGLYSLDARADRDRLSDPALYLGEHEGRLVFGARCIAVRVRTAYLQQLYSIRSRELYLPARSTS